MLVTQEETIWDISFPIELSLSSTESHRLLLKPGYYPTASLIISEFFNSVTNPHDGYQVNEDLQYDWNDTSTPNGWSVFKEARGNWTVHFRTSPSNMNIFFSQQPPHGAAFSCRNYLEEPRNVVPGQGPIADGEYYLVQINE